MSIGPQRPPPYRPQLPAFEAQWDDQRMCWSLYESPSTGNGRREKWIFSVDEPQHSETHCFGCERKILEHDLRLGYPVADKFSSGGVRTIYVHAHCLPEDVFEGCPAVSDLCGQKSTRHLVVWLGKHVHGFNSLKDERQINLAVGFRESLSCNAERIPQPQEAPPIATAVQQPASPQPPPAQKASAQKAAARQTSPAPISPPSPDVSVPEAPVLTGKVTKQQLDGLGISALRKYCRQLGLVGTGRRYLLVRRVLNKQMEEGQDTSSSEDEEEDDERRRRRTAPIAVPKAGKCRPPKRSRPADRSPTAAARGSKHRKANEPRKGSASTTASTASTGRGEQQRDEDLRLPISPRAAGRSKAPKQTGSRRLRKWSEKTHSKAHLSGDKSKRGPADRRKGETERRAKGATRKHQTARRHVDSATESDDEEEEVRLRTSSSSGPSCSSPVSVLAEGLSRTSKGDAVARTAAASPNRNEMGTSELCSNTGVRSPTAAAVVKTEGVVKREWHPVRGRSSPLHITVKREEASPTLKAEHPSTAAAAAAGEVVLSPSPTLGSPTEEGDNRQSEFTGEDRATEAASTVMAVMVRSPSPELGGEQDLLTQNCGDDKDPSTADNASEEAFGHATVRNHCVELAAAEEEERQARDDCDDAEEFEIWGDGNAEEYDPTKEPIAEGGADEQHVQSMGVLFGGEEDSRLEGSESMELLEWGSDSYLNETAGGAVAAEGDEADKGASGALAHFEDAPSRAVKAFGGERPQEKKSSSGAMAAGSEATEVVEKPVNAGLDARGACQMVLQGDGAIVGTGRQSEILSSRDRSHSRKASSRHGSSHHRHHHRGRSRSGRRRSRSSTRRHSSHCSSSHRHSSGSYRSYSAGDSPNRRSRLHRRRGSKENRTVLLSRDQVSTVPQLSVSPKVAEREVATDARSATKDAVEKPPGVMLNPREASPVKAAIPKGECMLRPAESAAVVTEAMPAAGYLQPSIDNQNASNVTTSTAAGGWDHTSGNEPTWSSMRSSCSPAGYSYRANYHNPPHEDWTGGSPSSGIYYPPYGSSSSSGPSPYTLPQPLRPRSFEAYASTSAYTTTGSFWSRQPPPPPPPSAGQQGLHSPPTSRRSPPSGHHYYGPGRLYQYRG